MTGDAEEERGEQTDSQKVIFTDTENRDSSVAYRDVSWKLGSKSFQISDNNDKQNNKNVFLFDMN